MTNLNRMRSALARCTPPERLDRQVIDRMRALRAEQRADEAGRRIGAHGRVSGAPSVGTVVASRRGFVVAGVAACLGVGAAGLGLASWTNGRATGGAAAGPSGEVRPFGLAVVYADEVSEPVDPGEAIALEARLDGLLPIGDASWSMTFRLNLSCAGEGIETVTYSLEGDAVRLFDGQLPSPVPDATLGDAVWGFYDYEEEVQKALADQVDGSVTFDLIEDPRIEAGQRGHATETRSLQRLEAGLDPVERFSFTVDYADESGRDGTFVTEWGNLYRVLRVSFFDAFWAIDDVLSAKHAWLEAGARGGETTEELQASMEEARAAYAVYEELFCEVAATEETLYAWLQSVNRACFGFAADALAGVVLHVDATFEDGSTARRSYRIEAVDDFDEAVDGRYEALVERYGLGSNAFDLAMAPFWNFSDYVPEPDEPDERLTRPMFAIRDVTGEQ